jgi:hypothetical protein
MEESINSSITANPIDSQGHMETSTTSLATALVTVAIILMILILAIILSGLVALAVYKAYSFVTPYIRNALTRLRSIYHNRRLTRTIAGLGRPRAQGVQTGWVFSADRERLVRDRTSMETVDLAASSSSIELLNMTTRETADFSL